MSAHVRAHAWSGTERMRPHAPPAPPARCRLVPLADLIDAITQQATRLRPPSAGQPHAFHEDKSELVGELRRLAARLRSDRP
ncbi:hypothetical protein C8P66_11325 [Humitalea rosea]|uniref:Uncharacterized protein n=1 Tax=Humitalea rosea TaxID=990373 RepID=A0A2W7IFK1_9PROT|nr:hypothetical protein C8P66_11325 [Humitalea rosea]